MTAEGHERLTHCVDESHPMVWQQGLFAVGGWFGERGQRLTNDTTVLAGHNDRMLHALRMEYAKPSRASPPAAMNAGPSAARSRTAGALDRALGYADGGGSLRVAPRLQAAAQTDSALRQQPNGLRNAVISCVQR